jgi:hypothetical protein
VTPLLWRIEGAPTKPNLDDWQEGLILHLLFQSLTLIIARREGQTRRYLVLEGCSGCRADGCERVCHRVLFEQLVRSTLPGITLVATPRLVARASESRQVLAVPHSSRAQLLDEAFLAQWPEGRLVTRALAAAGWRVAPLAGLRSRRAMQAGIPQAVRVGARAGEKLFAALRDPHCLTGLPADETGAGVAPTLAEGSASSRGAIPTRVEE